MALRALLVLVVVAAVAAAVVPQSDLSHGASPDQGLELSGRRLVTLDGIPLRADVLVLDVSGNLIQSWGKRPFRDACELRKLDASHNRLGDVDKEALSDVPALQVLNLSDNSITRLDSAAFPPLGALRDLDLSRNALESLHRDAFASLSGLLRLDLRANRLSTLGSLGGLGRVQTLLLSGNAIAECAPGALQELPALSELSLADNPGAGDLVLGGRRLERVDFSRSGLKTFPAALTPSVRTLLLAGNELRALRCGDLDSFPLLRLLDASACQLAAVEDDALGRLEQLDTLTLSANQLTSAPRSLPASLQSLRLDHNSITALEVGDLQGLRRLKLLNLRANKLQTIQDGALRTLVALEVLDLSDNVLLELPAGSLAGPHALRALYLANLRALPRAAWLPFPLQSPEHLQVLDLDMSPALARQLLADPAALTALGQLQVLRASDAGLHRLPSDLPQLLVHLRSLRLAGNPLACETLAQLAFWLRALSGDDKAICASPLSLAGRPLADLRDRDFHSSQDVAPQTERNPLPDRGLLEDLQTSENAIPSASSTDGTYTSAESITPSSQPINATLTLFPNAPTSSSTTTASTSRPNVITKSSSQLIPTKKTTALHTTPKADKSVSTSHLPPTSTSFLITSRWQLSSTIAAHASNRTGPSPTNTSAGSLPSSRTPSSATGAANSTARTPSSATGTPSSTTRTPRSAARTQSSADGTSSSVTSTSGTVTSTPSSNTRAPSSSDGTASSVIGTKSSTARTHSSLASTPSSVTGTPRSTTRTPSSTARTPGSVSGTSSTTRTPSSATGTPSSTTRIPSSATGIASSTTTRQGSLSSQASILIDSQKTITSPPISRKTLTNLLTNPPLPSPSSQKPQSTTSTSEWRLVSFSASSTTSPRSLPEQVAPQAALAATKAEDGHGLSQRHSVFAMFGLAGLGAGLLLLTLSWRRRQGLLRPPSMEDLVLRTADKESSESPELW